MEAIKGFVSNIFSAVSENLISGGAYYLIFKGILVTAFIAVSAWLIAAVLGVLISYVMCYEKKIVSYIGKTFCFVFRSVPVLLTILVFYYCVFGGSSFKGMLIVGMAIGLYGSGHLAEILAVAVEREQKNLSANLREKLGRVYYTTVIPQAVQDSMFQIKRLTIQLFQWTTVAGYVAVNDLTEVMDGIGQRTMYPFFSIFFAAICYIIATIFIELIFRFIEKRMK